MNRFGMLLSTAGVAALLVGLMQGTATARPPYGTAAKEYFAESKAADVIAEAKCNLCHGKNDEGKDDKKVRNDFGKAIAKAGLDKAKFDELKADKGALTKCFNETLTKVLESEDGKAFQERIDAGKVPAEK